MESSFVVWYIFFLASVYTSALDAGVDSDHSSKTSACPEIPIVENADVSTTSLKSNYTKGDLLIYSCQQGYIGRVTFVCDGQKWRNARNTKCSRKRCQLPEDIPNGRFVVINGTEFVYETTIKYTCKTGYRMVSLTDTRTCLAEGWSNHLPHCEEIICSPPVAKDNLIVDGLPDYDDNPLKYGHQLKFTCNSVELKLVGTNEITCGENGEWSHPFPKCEEIICELEAIHGVSVFGVPQNNAPIKFGHKLFFHCSQPGMVLIGRPEVTCSAEGKWSNSFPLCEVRKGCGPPPYVEFAGLVALKKTFYNSEERVEYHCQRLYTLDGDNNFMTCVQGKWTGSVRCLKPCIVTIDDMDNNKIILLKGPQRIMYAPHKDHITFKCPDGRYPTRNVAFRQQCINGVMYLPSCY